VIVDRGGLSRQPDQGDERIAAVAGDVKDVLPIAGRVRLALRRLQQTRAPQERPERLSHPVSQFRLVLFPVHHGVDAPDQVIQQPILPLSRLHGSSSRRLGPGRPAPGPLQASLRSESEIVGSRGVIFLRPRRKRLPQKSFSMPPMSPPICLRFRFMSFS